jgi:hypothetical protein
MERNPSVVYHGGVMCQVDKEKGNEFYGKIKSLNPTFYFFVEGNGVGGYAASGKGDTGDHFAWVMTGTVAKMISGAKLINSEVIEHAEECKEMWEDLKVVHFLMNVYKLI